MEPSQLNSSQGDDEKLIELLRQRSPVLPDNGFSDRVVAALPAKANRKRIGSVAASVGSITGGIAGFVVALNRGASLKGAGEAVMNNLGDGLSLATSPWLLLAIGVTVFSLFLSYFLIGLAETRIWK